MEISNDILILFGGYSDNHYHNDTWYYYINEDRWLMKTDFVHAEYPENCTSDLVDISLDEECVELQYPNDLQRASEPDPARNIRSDDVLPFKDQPGYTPDPDEPLYFGIVDDAELLVTNLREKFLENEVIDEAGVWAAGWQLLPQRQLLSSSLCIASVLFFF